MKSTKHKVRYEFKQKYLDLFWYWINERHAIYLKRKEGKPWPWTDDEILRNYKFTNVYRQLDRVTQEWTDRFCRLLSRGKSMMDGDILFHICQFRLFNLPESYDAIYYGMQRWNKTRAIEILKKRREDGHKIFTGAYMVTPGGGDDKVEMYCQVLDYVYENREDLALRIVESQSMKETVQILQEIHTVGAFIAYEIACDLRHTRILADATDVFSWANPGPGAKRGIHRLLTGKKEPPEKFKVNYVRAMRQLLRMTYRRGTIKKHVKNCEWPFEMREIEHSLCEFDKYMRVKQGEGRPRSVYRPSPQLEIPF